MQTTPQGDLCLFDLEESAIITTDSNGQPLISSIGPSGRKLFAPAYCNPFKLTVHSLEKPPDEVSKPEEESWGKLRTEQSRFQGFDPSSRGISYKSSGLASIIIEEISPIERNREMNQRVVPNYRNFADSSFMSFDNFKEGVYPLLMNLPDAHVTEEFLRVM